jgi:hypothetical protein
VETAQKEIDNSETEGETENSEVEDEKQGNEKGGWQVLGIGLAWFWLLTSGT